MDEITRVDDVPDVTLAEARAAFAGGDWGAARTAFVSAGSSGRLSVADAILAARAAWYLGDSRTFVAEAEAAYHRLTADGVPEDAAQLALRLAVEWGNRGEIPVMTAWVARARDHLRDVPPRPVHGYLRYVEGTLAGEVEGDATAPLESAADISQLARRFDDPVLPCFANVLQGLGMVRHGRTSEGFERLDDAMLPVLAGHVDPAFAGDVYCTVIHLCEGLADLARMRAWTDALERWAEPVSHSFVYAGVTRVHHLQLRAAEGDWDRVERELGGSSAALTDLSAWVAGAGFVALGDVRRLRGDAAGAAEAYALARANGVSAEPGSAWLEWMGGHRHEALGRLRAALAGEARLGRAGLLLPAVEMSLALGRSPDAEQLAGELAVTAEFYGTAGLRARSAQARALVAIASGRAHEAVPLLESAAQVYREQRYRHALGEVHEQLSRAHAALGDRSAEDAARATALAIYDGLGATASVEHLATSDGHAPGGLTRREWEVLAKVAEGGSNRDVAGALFISEKTVGRHLANIYEKLGVTSRTAAAAWAHEQSPHRA